MGGSFLPVATSVSRITGSPEAEAEAMILPSAEKERERMPPSYSTRVRIALPVATSHKRMEPLRRPVEGLVMMSQAASTLPLGEKASEKIMPGCRSRAEPRRTRAPSGSRPPCTSRRASSAGAEEDSNVAERIARLANRNADMGDLLTEDKAPRQGRV